MLQNLIAQHKGLLFWLILSILVCSLSITFIFEHPLSDSLSIVASVFALIALVFTSVLLVLDTILDICNP
ncbi:hypothetical protein [Acinetobacter indicus]|uniref:hypothetical protein n=1 Tax=Acinetobacter indicus TaxID=756892 RepID=UPI0009488ACE|nr:hypothetical protein [Acinetobacter indicus]